MKTLQVIFVVSALGLCIGATNTDNRTANKTFPQHWDPQGFFRDSGRKVLAWSHWNDRNRVFQVRFCLAVELIQDGLGKTSYKISEFFTNDTPYHSWAQAYIIEFPEFGRDTFHRTKSFDHKPKSSEMDDLLREWYLHLHNSENGWDTLEYGVDETLWRSVLGCAPNIAMQEIR